MIKVSLYWQYPYILIGREAANHFLLVVAPDQNRVRSGWVEAQRRRPVQAHVVLVNRTCGEQYSYDDHNMTLKREDNKKFRILFRHVKLMYSAVKIEKKMYAAAETILILEDET